MSGTDAYALTSAIKSAPRIRLARLSIAKHAKLALNPRAVESIEKEGPGILKIVTRSGAWHLVDGNPSDMADFRAGDGAEALEFEVWPKGRRSDSVPG